MLLTVKLDFQENLTHDDKLSFSSLSQNMQANIILHNALIFEQCLLDFHGTDVHKCRIISHIG